MKSQVFETESLLKVIEGVSYMGIEVQRKKPMNFHSIKSLSEFMMLQVNHFVMSFMSGVEQLTNASNGQSKAS